MKKTFLTLLVGAFSFSYAQIGIGTSTPQKKLHVNGDLQVTNELNIGGSATAVGTAGTKGQMLVSNGSGVAPSWSDNSVVKMSILARKTTTATTSSTGGTSTKVIFNTMPLVDNAKVTYNSTTGNFTFVTAGYYQVLTTTHMNLSDNASGETSGTGQTTIYLNGTATANIQGQTVANYAERTENPRHTTGATFYANAGDIMTVYVSHTRPYKVMTGAATINYLGS
jgi:hypothetical protein